MWQCNRYINIFGYKFYYKQFFLFKIAKPLNLSCYRNWKAKKNRKKKKYGKTLNVQAKKLKVKSNICYVCKEIFKDGDNITLEHIIPRSVLKIKSLYDNPSNHALSHYACNQKKGNETK